MTRRRSIAREHYDPTGLIAVEEDANGDGVADKWETYRAGVLATAVVRREL